MAIGFHSSTSPNKRCYGLCITASVPVIDVQDVDDSHSAAFERFHRAVKEQIIHGRTYANLA